jgi:alkaline phosphatase D
MAGQRGERRRPHAHRPRSREKGDRLRIAVGSCQQYEQGWFVAHRHLAAEGADLVLFVGDYIYESSWGRDHVRKHHQPEPKTLAQYRDRYALYKTDADLQKSHAAAPWIVTWDDHEVDNDLRGRSLRGPRSRTSSRAAPRRTRRSTSTCRCAAPPCSPAAGCASTARSTGAASRASTSSTIASTARTRPARVPIAAAAPRWAPEVHRSLDPELTLLGAEQERWLDESLARSKAAWNVIVQQTLFVPAGRATTRAPSSTGPIRGTAIPAARERMLRTLSERRPRQSR